MTTRGVHPPKDGGALMDQLGGSPFTALCMRLPRRRLDHAVSRGRLLKDNWKDLTRKYAGGCMLMMVWWDIVNHILPLYSGSLPESRATLHLLREHRTITGKVGICRGGQVQLHRTSSVGLASSG
jgi:hypothetical protein